MSETNRQHKTLILTVGTTAEPIVHSIEEAADDKSFLLDIYLIYGCSLPGQPQPHPVDIAANIKKTILGKVNSVTLKEIDDPQDLDRCISVCEEMLENISRETVAETVVNITGGTKAMAGALTLAACEKQPMGLVFEYVGGTRGDNNGRVTANMLRREFRGTALQQYLKRIKNHIRKCNYAQALALCDLLPPSAHAAFLKRTVESLVLWDNFEYNAALSKIPGASGISLLTEDKLFSGLAVMMENLRKCAPVRKVIAELKEYGNKQGGASVFKSKFQDEPLLLIADTLENAGRRLQEKKYVDVAMRSYRSMEASIQICLIKKWGINPWLLKEDLIKDCEGYLLRINRTSMPVELALNNGFELIQHLNGDFPSSILNDFVFVRNIRNNCYIEHGYRDVDVDIARRCVPAAQNVCLAVLQCCGYSKKSFYDACASVRHNLDR